jgi:hypothetical protein
MVIGYDIYDCFTMEHFRLRQRMTLTIKIIARDCTSSEIFSHFSLSVFFILLNGMVEHFFILFEGRRITVLSLPTIN